MREPEMVSPEPAPFHLAPAGLGPSRYPMMLALSEVAPKQSCPRPLSVRAWRSIRGYALLAAGAAHSRRLDHAGGVDACTHALTVMIGEKAAAMIAEDL